MTDDRFIATVRDRAGDLDGDEAARRTSQAVLAVLAGQLTGAAQRELAASLPEPASTFLSNAGEEQGRPLSTEALFAEVARREGLDDRELADETRVAAHVQAVFEAVRECADPEAIDSAREQLGADLRRLWLPADEDEVAAGLPEPREDERTS